MGLALKQPRSSGWFAQGRCAGGETRGELPRKRYARLGFAQKRKIAELVGQGRSASELADSFGASIATVYDIRNESRLRGSAVFIEYHDGSRKKKSLGWLSPKEYRLSLGYAA